MSKWDQSILRVFNRSRQPSVVRYCVLALSLVANTWRSANAQESSGAPSRVFPGASEAIPIDESYFVRPTSVVQLVDQDDESGLFSNNNFLALAQQPAPRTTTTPNQPTNPNNTQRQRRAATNDLTVGSQASALGGAQAPTASGVCMIGDFFIGAGQIGEGTEAFASIPNAGGTRRVKIGDNDSPIPRDRVFIAYNYFDDAIQSPDQTKISVNRYTPGFEKTIFGGLASFEIRTPFASTQNPNVNLTGFPGGEMATIFGNMSLTLKTLLLRTDNFALGAGAGFTLPTAQNANIYLFRTNQPTVVIKNDSVHIMPYLGGFWTPREKIYITGFTQFDFDANGNAVYSNPVFSSPGQRYGRLNEQSLLYIDVAIGYWLYRDPTARRLTGISPTFEYHYTSTLQNADLVQTQFFQLGNTFNRYNISNMTAGVHFLLGAQSVFTLATVMPINTAQENRQFDYEVVAQFNRYF